MKSKNLYKDFKLVALLNNANDIYGNALRKGLALPPDFNVWEWADERRMLSSEGSAEPGPWRTSRVPYAREIMECLSPSHPCTIVAWMKPSQICATEVLTNWWASGADLDPGPFVLVEATGDMCNKISKLRIATAIRDTPCLNEIIAPVGIRESGNTIRMKEYRGGSLIIVSPTSSNFRLVSARYMALDEVDSYDEDVEDEGDAIALAKKRCANFPNRKIFITSTPKLKETSIIEKAFLKGDQRRYHVPCPHCSTPQILEFDNLKFTHENYEIVGAVEYLCKTCGCLVPEYNKTEMLKNGKWIPENKDRGQYPSFHINALYAPLGWTSWADIVADFLEFKKVNSIPLQKVWTNTLMARTWEIMGDKTEWGNLLKRREDYGPQINHRICVITAGADVHPDRIEICVLGHLIYEETYVLEHKILMGDTQKLAVWERLDEFRKKTYLHERGMMRISCVGIDSAYQSNEVYEYCKTREDERVYAVRGKAGRGRPIAGKPNKQPSGVLLFTIGDDTVKDTIYGRLKIKKPGGGYFHFPLELPEEWFKQLLAEILNFKKKKKTGRKELFYEKIRERNEALDCVKYGIGALYILAYMVYPNQTVLQMLELLTAQLTRVGGEKKPKRVIY